MSATPRPRAVGAVSPSYPARVELPDSSARRLSVNQTTTVRWSLPEAIAEYRAAGLQCIGVSLDRLRECGAARAADELQRAGLIPSSLGWVGGFTGAQGHSFEEAVRDAREAIAAAHCIGARTLIVVPGPLCGHIRSHARRLLIEALVELVEEATEADVCLAIQPMHPLFEDEWSFLTSLDATLDVLTRFDHRHIGLAFGAYHLWQEPGLIERVPEFAKYVAAVQLSDWREPPRCDNDRLLPGDGVIPLTEIINALEASGYRGFYEIEVWSRDLWKRDHRSLIRECMLRFAHVMTTPT